MFILTCPEYVSAFNDGRFRADFDDLQTKFFTKYLTNNSDLRYTKPVLQLTTLRLIPFSIAMLCLLTRIETEKVKWFLKTALKQIVCLYV